jgi:hypothetical protein
MRNAAPPTLLLKAAAVLAGVAALLATGCGTGTSTLKFRCDREVNGGTLLTVDMVRASEAEVERIRALGEKWFYDSLRESLRDRTKTATFSQGDARCDKEVEIPVRKEDKFLVLIGDYRFQSADPGRYLIVMPKERWKKKTISVQIHDRDLTVVEP